MHTCHQRVGKCLVADDETNFSRTKAELVASEYEDSDTLRSLSDGENGDNEGFGDELTTEDVMEVPPLHIGMKFASPELFRWDVIQNAIRKRFEVRFSVNKRKKVVG